MRSLFLNDIRPGPKALLHGWSERTHVARSWVGRESVLIALLLFGSLWFSGQESGLAQQSSPSSPFQWDVLPPLPGGQGLSGPFAGVHGDILIVAGGVSLASDETPGGDSTNWSEGILALSDPQGRWQRVGSLLHPLANGVSLATEEGLVLLGGADQNRHYAEVLMLRWGGGNLETVYLPPMPGTAAYFCGARLGDRIYVAGGRQQPDSPTALRTFWSLDLSKKGLEQKWQELEPWPGPARMLAVAGVQDGSFYLMGGMDFESAQAPTGQVRHLATPTGTPRTGTGNEWQTFRVQRWGHPTRRSHWGSHIS